jgi:hypothetical protein
LTIIEYRMTCKACNVERECQLVRTIANNGASQVYWMCKICRTNARGGGVLIPHEKIKARGIEIKDIPIEKDYRTDKCAVCGETGTELHHFAPKHLFGSDEAEKWPKTYLCKNHHTMWHRIVTPDMGKGSR